MLTPQAGPAAWLAQRALFRKAVEADPTLGEAWAGLAFTYTNMAYTGHSLDPAADLREAEAAVERAVALAPDSSDVHAARCAVLRRYPPDRLDEALAACRRALELSPSSHSARANLGRILIMLGRAEEASVLVRTSIAAAPDNHALQPLWHYYVGLADLLLGRGDRGAESLRRALAAWRYDGLAIMVSLTAALALNGQVVEAGQILSPRRGSAGPASPSPASGRTRPGRRAARTSSPSWSRSSPGWSWPGCPERAGAPPRQGRIVRLPNISTLRSRSNIACPLRAKSLMIMSRSSASGSRMYSSAPWSRTSWRVKRPSSPRSRSTQEAWMFVTCRTL